MGMPIAELPPRFDTTSARLPLGGALLTERISASNLVLGTAAKEMGN